MSDEERSRHTNKARIALVMDFDDQIRHAQTPEGKCERISHDTADWWAKAVATAASLFLAFFLPAASLLLLAASFLLLPLIGKFFESATKWGVRSAILAVPAGYLRALCILAFLMWPAFVIVGAIDPGGTVSATVKFLSHEWDLAVRFVVSLLYP